MQRASGRDRQELNGCSNRGRDEDAKREQMRRCERGTKAPAEIDSSVCGDQKREPH